MAGRQIAQSSCFAAMSAAERAEAYANLHAVLDLLSEWESAERAAKARRMIESSIGDTEPEGT